jgi:hypothetical protein
MGCDGEEHGDFEGEGDGGAICGFGNIDIFDLMFRWFRLLVFDMLIFGPSSMTYRNQFDLCPGVCGWHARDGVLLTFPA